MEEFTSSLSKRLYFSKYPNEEELDILRNNLGDFTLVNLTSDEENLPPINYEKQIIKEIIDRKVLDDKETIELVKQLAILYCQGEILVINCRGGAGRSATIAGLLYGFVRNIQSSDVYIKLTKAFEKRTVKSEKLIKLGVPQTKDQKDQIKRLLKPFDFYKSTDGPWTNFYPSKVYSNKFLKTFRNSEALYHAYKNPADDEYIDLLTRANATASKVLGRKTKMVENFEENKIEYMIEVLIDKVDSNPWILDEMKKIGIRPIFEHTRNDSFWGDSLDRTGQNHLGKCWKKVLLTYLINE